MFGNVLSAVVVLGCLGALFGALLAVASKIFEVKKDPREEAILGKLAGANCGGCGYPGCAGCAAAIVAGNAPVTACAPAGPDAAAAIAEIMGQSANVGERETAFVRCHGGQAASRRFEYIGVSDCVAAMKVAGGPLNCQWGCLGLGSCVKACKFGAIHIDEQGYAVVDEDKCTDCMACAAVCPRHLIVSIPVSSKTRVMCSNQNKGKVAMSVCKNACVGCGLCAKECYKDAIHVVNDVASVDYDKCINCKLCSIVCPRDAIRPVATMEEKYAYRELKKKELQSKKKAAELAAAKAGKPAAAKADKTAAPAQK